MNNVINNEKTEKSVLIPIILCVILFVGAFLLGKYNKEVTKFLKFDKSSEIDNDIKQDSNDVPKEAITLREAIDIVDGKVSFSSFFVEEEKSVLDAENFIKTYSNQAKLGKIINKINAETNSNDKITKEKVEEYALELYGSKDYIKHENLICEMDDVPLYIYDVASEEYNINPEHGGHGLEAPPFIYDKYLNFKTEGNKYIITTNRIYTGMPFGPSTGNVGTYRSYSDYKKKQNKLFTIESSDRYDDPYFEKRVIDTFEKNYKNYNLPIYKYTFTKEDGKIKLLSYEIIR